VKKLYIGNVSYQASEQDLREWFSSAGINADSVTLIRDSYTNQPRGFAFAEISNDAEAERAIQELANTKVGVVRDGTRLTEALKSLADIVADSLWATSVAPNAPTSIPALLSANDSVQGLSGQTFTAWNARGLSNVGTAPASISFASGSFATTGIPNMRRLWNNSEEGGIGPEVCITTYDVSELYEAALQPQQRFMGAVRTPDGGFTSIAFRGTPILADRKCATGQMAVLNVSDQENGMQMDFLEGAAFNFLDWKPALKQTAMIRPLVATMNLSIGNRQFGSNRMDSITA